MVIRMDEEKLREFEEGKDFKSLIQYILKHERELPLIYANWHRIMFDLNPRVSSLLQALEHIAMLETSIINQIIDLVIEKDDGAIAPVMQHSFEEGAEWTKPSTQAENRDNIFTINSLNQIISGVEDTEPVEEKVDLVFWYIKGGQNESKTVNVPANQHFGKILHKIIEEGGFEKEAKFSISPLGFDPLLLHEIDTNAKGIIDKYDYELTLVVML